MTLRTVPVLLGLGLCALGSAQSYYLALGDSVAFGLHKVTTGGTFGYNAPSNGDRAYVGAVADALGAVEGGRPTVINLSLPGETSGSFVDTSDLYRGANTNYGPLFAPTQISQHQFAQNKIAALHGSITTVSFAIGANDLLALDGTLNPDPTAALADIDARYAAFLSELRTELPAARLILPGYYNPYAPDDSKHDAAAGAIGLLNLKIQGYAAAYGGRYVDFYTPIEGHQAEYITADDIHPNDAGYAVLGRAAAQAVPEPASMAALGLGALAMLRRRRR